MTDEDAFLRKLLEQPGNDLTRVVYADWLDEQGTPDAVAKAEFLRLIADAELMGTFAERAKELAGQLPPNWLAVVSKLPVENCSAQQPDQTVSRTAFRFDYVCLKRWDEMTVTESSEERFCGKCQKIVYYCSTIREAKVHAIDNHCVAVDLAIPRKPGDLWSSMMFAGEPTRDDYLEVIRGEPNDPVSEAREKMLDDEPLRRSWWARLWRRNPK